ncbi:MAG TPA: TadE family protein [Alphaproteobacteria bacterium]|nr:TadE family protein [Alphaproteobacteria bacterium]
MHLKREEGAAAVEFALVLPLLLMILFGIIEFGLVLFRQEVITNASREGARFGILIGDPRPTTEQIEDVVNTYLTNAGLDAGNATVSVTGAQGASGGDLTVSVLYPYDFLVLPNFALGLSDTLNLSATTVMKME